MASTETAKCDWDRDDFMHKWDTTYVATNLKPDARPYDDEMFLELHKTLAASPDLARIAHCILVSLIDLEADSSD